MKSWRNKALLLAGGAALLIALPALSQNAPESLLPPGFGDPQTLPPPEEKAAPTPQPSSPSSPASPSAAPAAPLEGLAEADPEDVAEVEPPRPTNYFTIPEGEARPVYLVGVLEPGNRGLGPDAFGAGNGRFLAELMNRLDAPLPSRWTSILLRRALLSRLQAPAGIHPTDWVAARADLLLRMGEADAARMLVQSVDREYYTPRMIEVAAQTALATSDPAALCPLVEPAQRGSNDAVWTLAEAMCAALEGEGARAAALVDEARGRGGAGGIDLMLAEKVIGAGSESRRAATIDWEGVGGINPWRFGLASATGTQIPDPLWNGAEPRLRAWYARAPMMPLEQRLEAASVAAALGVFSSQSLVEIYSLMLDQTDPADLAGTVAARLRAAWTESGPNERLSAMRAIWDEQNVNSYGRLILTAGAAARIPASADHASDARNLIASMLSAGLDRRAAAWAPVIQESGDERAWAMIAVSSPEGAVDLSPDRVEQFIAADDSAEQRRARLLVAGLVGLGRISDGDVNRLASAAGVDLGGDDRWSQAIDAAARARQTGTVVLLAGVGMQTNGWSGVPPRHLARIVRALRAVGMDYEARMIAAEAVARL